MIEILPEFHKGETLQVNPRQIRYSFILNIKVMNRVNHVFSEFVEITKNHFDNILAFKNIMMGTTIKNERHDDAEINEMARRIVEQNRQKLAQPGMPMGYPPGMAPGGMQMVRPGQPMISNYMQGGNVHLGQQVNHQINFITFEICIIAIV